MTPVEITIDSAFSTDSSLLGHIKANDPQAWRRFVELYGPIVYRWTRRSGIAAVDAGDVAQEVFRSVWSHIDRFRRDRPGDSFRGWLWTITRNKIRDHFRARAISPDAAGGSSAQAQLMAVPEMPPDDSDAVGFGSAVVRRALELVQAECEPRTWQAFWRTAVESQAPADVARDLDMSVAAVYMARSRLFRRLRQELGEMLD